MIEKNRPEYAHPLDESATRPLTRSGERLAVSLVLAGDSMLRPRFVPATRPNAPSGALNYRF